jgi:hypothetical protein
LDHHPSPSIDAKPSTVPAPPVTPPPFSTPRSLNRCRQSSSRLQPTTGRGPELLTEKKKSQRLLS